MSDSENRLKIAELLYQERKSMGLTQKSLVKRVLAPYNISLAQYRRAEQADPKITWVYLVRIADALQIDLSEMLFDHKNRALLARYSEDEVEYYNQNLAKAFYPRRNDFLDGSYQTRSMFRLFLYQPLFPKKSWYDILWRVSGCIPNNEDYLVDLLSELYNQLTDSPALRYAKYVDEYLLHVPFKSQLAEKKWQEYYHSRGTSEEIREGYREYRKILASRLEYDE